MFLSKYELIPSVIVDVNDPEHLGRIKCDIPGKIDSEQISTENLPWVYPLHMNGHQTFSKLIVGGKVLVYANNDNYLEFWYEPMHEVLENRILKKFLDEHYEDNPEVLLCRDGLGGSSVMITYDDENGINLMKGDSTITIGPDNNITINTTSQININSSTVNIGSKDGNITPAVRADLLAQQFNKLGDQITATGHEATNGASLEALKSFLKGISQDNFKSENVNIV